MHSQGSSRTSASNREKRSAAQRLPGECITGAKFGQFFATAPRLFATWERFDRAHTIELLRQPYYYLSLLATHPDHAGNGFGIGLLADNLGRIDAERVPAYLESTNRANDRRYERLGFAPCGEFELPEDGPDVVQMWRDPA